jgi:hypothetical protein
LALQERNFVNPYFGGFFHEPLQTVHAFGRGKGYMNVERLSAIFFFLPDYFHLALSAGKGRKPGGVESTSTIHQVHHIPLFQAKDFGAVAAFFFRNPEIILFQIRGEK